MKKLITTLAIFAFTSVAAFAQDAKEPNPNNPNAPVITFREKVVDYGTIEKGAPGARVFTFTNTGKEPLIITQCQGSCGCTVPTCPKTPIAPGASGEIKVKYDTRRVGGFQKTITVRSNASNSVVVLKIKGKVNPKPVENTAPVKKEEGKSAIRK